MRIAKLLVVEDESLVAEEIALRLRQLGHDATAVADNAQDAFAFARAVRPDMALVDIHIKGPVNGIEVALWLDRQAVRQTDARRNAGDRAAAPARRAGAGCSMSSSGYTRRASSKATASACASSSGSSIGTRVM